jgi:hypothetical protein
MEGEPERVSVTVISVCKRTCASVTRSITVFEAHSYNQRRGKCLVEFFRYELRIEEEFKILLGELL